MDRQLPHGYWSTSGGANSSKVSRKSWLYTLCKQEPDIKEMVIDDDDNIRKPKSEATLRENLFPKSSAQ